jgi:polyisoprenoid-binding protein YceI
VKGTFREISGKGTVAPSGEVSGTLVVAAASLDTKNARRDKHLRSDDFFDSDHHPSITFEAINIQASGDGVAVTGTLTVRDRTLPLSFDAVVSVRGVSEVWLDAEIRVDRADFGLTWNGLGASTQNALSIHAGFTRS